MPTGIYKHKPLSLETKKKIGLSNKGRNKGKSYKERYGLVKAKEIRQKLSEAQLKRKDRDGYINSPKTREKISKLKIGHIVTKKTRRKIALNNSISHKGKKLTKEHKRNISKALEGEKHYNWKGVTPLNKLLRGKSKWKIWREFVFLRDNFTCQNPNCSYCDNKIGVLLHPHHIKPLALYPELVFDINNGITYCTEFHLKSGLHKEIQKNFIEEELKCK